MEELAEDEEESQREKLKSRWAALEKVVGAQPRVARVAADIVEHFEERDTAQPGKAMVVAMSRDICVHLYDEIVKLRPDWHTDDPELGAIKIVMTGSASDRALLRPHIYSAQVKKRLEARFKKPGDPLRVVIVRDMWLTGFDAPCVHTLYVDKPMKGHNLMQAIARVNRVFKDKQGGLVVDYIGIANELKSALKEYTASQGRGRPTVDAHEAYSVLAERLDALRGMLHGFDYSGFLTGGHKTLAGTANHVLGIKDGKRRFADTALAMSQAFTLCCTLDEAKAVREEVAFMQGVKVILTKRDIAAQKKTNEARELAIRQIINSAVVSESVVDIFDAVGLGQARHRHPGRRLPGGSAQPARTQSGGRTARTPAGRRDQVTLCEQCGATQEVLRPADGCRRPLPEPLHRSRAGDGRTGANGQEVPRGCSAR